MKKRLKICLFHFLCLIGLEGLFEIILFDNYMRTTLFSILFFILPISLFISILTQLFKRKINLILGIALYGILGFWFSLEYIFSRVFQTFFSISLFKLSDQVFAFGSETILAIFKNLPFVILFFIPLLVCFFADLSLDGKIEWFGYVAGALMLSYVAFALPLWFKKPNPVIFVPCNFVAIALYLLYINFATGGSWFLSFAFPAVGGICLITCTVVTLMHYLHRGRLYILGGAFMALGVFMLLVEFLLKMTFGLRFIGWSIYPLVVLFLFGGLLIYFAINSAAREMIERKLFF